jgi:negative regulator of replication initiation
LEDLALRIKEVRAQQKELEVKRNQLIDEMNEGAHIDLALDRIREYVDSLKNLLESSSFLEQKTFLKSFLKRIE